jgi:hypothetical protein
MAYAVRLEGSTPRPGDQDIGDARTPREEAPREEISAMTKRTFWEKLGRGMGRGLKKAVEMGSQISDQVEGKLELEKARETLEAQHAQLGKAIADEALAREGEPFAVASEEIRDLLDAIGKQRETVERLEEERLEEERLRKEREAKRSEESASEKGSHEPPEASRIDDGRSSDPEGDDGEVQ